MTILLTYCRQVRLAKLCHFHKSLVRSVCRNVVCKSSNMSKQKIFVTRPDVPEAGLNMLKER
jgi:hypothetical protein